MRFILIYATSPAEILNSIIDVNYTLKLEAKPAFNTEISCRASQSNKGTVDNWKSIINWYWKASIVINLFRGGICGLMARAIDDIWDLMVIYWTKDELSRCKCTNLPSISVAHLPNMIAHFLNDIWLIKVGQFKSTISWECSKRTKHYLDIWSICKRE